MRRVPLPIILASCSAARKRLLEMAGVSFTTVAPVVDEEGIKRESASEDILSGELAIRLAQAKALAVAKSHLSSIVVGADQILIVEGKRLGKPRDVAAAREQLLGLRGRSHALKTAVVCALGDRIEWTHVESAQLTMRNFTTEYLETYLAAEGPAVTESVGGYKIEGRGIQLFETIAGDYFGILGLPLLPLLRFLRSCGAIP